MSPIQVMKKAQSIIFVLEKSKGIVHIPEPNSRPIEHFHVRFWGEVGDEEHQSPYCDISVFLKKEGNDISCTPEEVSLFFPYNRANSYCASLLRTQNHVMHRAREPSTKMNNDRADGHFHSFV